MSLTFSNRFSQNNGVDHPHCSHRKSEWIPWQLYPHPTLTNSPKQVKAEIWNALEGKILCFQSDHETSSHPTQEIPIWAHFPTVVVFWNSFTFWKEAMYHIDLARLLSKPDQFLALAHGTAVGTCWHSRCLGEGEETGVLHVVLLSKTTYHGATASLENNTQTNPRWSHLKNSQHLTDKKKQKFSSIFHYQWSLLST